MLGDKDKYKVTDIKTGGIKIVGGKKSTWYRVRKSRYTVENISATKFLKWAWGLD